MSETISLGIVISKLDYQEHDEIVTILTESGKVTLIANGVRKIESKNRYALQLGNLVEFSFFQARLEGKVSKLKKAVSIFQIDLTNKEILSSIHEIILIFKKFPDSSHLSYKNIIKTYMNFNVNLVSHLKTYLLFSLLPFLGLGQRLGFCVECLRQNMINDYSFYKGGFLCRNHSMRELDIEVLKGIKNLGYGFEKYQKMSHEVNLAIYGMIKNFINVN